MKISLSLLFIALIISATFYSCVGYQSSTSVGFGVSSGPYGYGAYRYPNVNYGVYRGGYRGW